MHAESLKSCLTLCNPMDCSPPGSSVHGILQARILGGRCHGFLEGFFQTHRLKLCLLWFLHCMWILYHWATSEARICYSSFLRYLLMHLFIWLYQILVVACRIFSFSVACRIFSFGMWTLSFGIWDLIPWPGIEPIPPVLGAWSLIHWTTREIPYYTWFLITNCPLVCYLLYN